MLRHVERRRTMQQGGHILSRAEDFVFDNASARHTLQGMLDSNFVYVLSTRVVTSAFLLVLGLIGCGGEGPDNPDKTDAPGAAEAVGSDAQAIQQAPTFERIEHYVPVGPNRTIHLTETRRAGGCHHNRGVHWS